jgi:hypothetical protein
MQQRKCVNHLLYNLFGAIPFGRENLWLLRVVYEIPVFGR